MWTFLGIIAVFLLVVFFAVNSVFTPDSGADLISDLRNRNDRGMLKRPSEKHVTR